MTKQLHKLVNVLKIRDLEPDETVARELALFKISADGESRGEIMQFVEIFRGKVVDVDKRSVIVEVTGTDEKIEAFERMVRPFGLIEMVRTGEIAVSRGRGARPDHPTGTESALAARSSGESRERSRRASRRCAAVTIEIVAALAGSSPRPSSQRAGSSAAASAWNSPTATACAGGHRGGRARRGRWARTASTRPPQPVPGAGPRRSNAATTGGAARGAGPSGRRLQLRPERRRHARLVVSFHPALLVLPELSLLRNGGPRRLTLCTVVRPMPDESPPTRRT